MKMCAMCKESKDGSVFWSGKRFHVWCSECRREYARLFYRKNKDKVLSRVKEYRIRNSEKIRERQRIYHQRAKQKIHEKYLNWTEEQKQNNRDGALRYYHEHKEERKQYSRDYALSNKDKIRARKKSYRLRNKDKFRQVARERRSSNKREFRSRRLMEEYGITADDYDRMYSEQGGLCLICGKSEKLFVDHSHITGKVRSLLCSKCNSLIGFCRENTPTLESAIEYLGLHGDKHA